MLYKSKDLINLKNKNTIIINNILLNDSCHDTRKKL